MFDLRVYLLFGCLYGLAQVFFILAVVLGFLAFETCTALALWFILLATAVLLPLLKAYCLRRLGFVDWDWGNHLKGSLDFVHLYWLNCILYWGKLIDFQRFDLVAWCYLLRVSNPLVGFPSSTSYHELLTPLRGLLQFYLLTASISNRSHKGHHRTSTTYIIAGIFLNLLSFYQFGLGIIFFGRLGFGLHNVDGSLLLSFGAIVILIFSGSLADGVVAIRWSGIKFLLPRFILISDCFAWFQLWVHIYLTLFGVHVFLFLADAWPILPVRWDRVGHRDRVYGRNLHKVALLSTSINKCLWSFLL